MNINIGINVLKSGLIRSVHIDDFQDAFKNPSAS